MGVPQGTEPGHPRLRNLLGFLSAFPPQDWHSVAGSGGLTNFHLLQDSKMNETQLWPLRSSPSIKRKGHVHKLS